VAEVHFSSRILRRFAEAAALELGADQFSVMLGLANLPAGWSKPESFLKMDPAESAKAYSALQGAMRSYFGRGARGVLLRVGQGLWNRMLEEAGFGIKAQSAVIKRLPISMRRKPALELLGKLLGGQTGDITLHNLDLDLLLVDHASPTADGHREPAPICFVTRGLIRESLIWSMGGDFDVEETACKAQGRPACEFKITTGK